MAANTNIFSDSTEFPVPLYPILTILLSLSIYTALHHFNLQKILTKIFSLSSTLPPTLQTTLYLVLLNIPTIVLSTISLIIHNSLIGFQISCDIDYIHIVIVSAYICFIQESRQTPIRGVLFVRDLIFMGMQLGVLVLFWYDGVVRLEYGVVIVVVYVVYFVLQNCEEFIQDSLLRVLNIKQPNVYNSTFLLTQPNKQSNHLHTRNTIEQNKQTIETQINQFKEMLQKLFNSESQKQILLNFGKLFLPYKNAIQIEQDNAIQENVKKIADDWLELVKYQPGQDVDDGEGNRDREIDREVQKEGDGEDGGKQGEILRNQSGKPDQSVGSLMYNRTMTDDYVIEIDQSLQLQTSYAKAFRYVFYPLYLISTVDGRPRYFLDYLCIILLCILMWLISGSCSYLTSATSHTSYSSFSLLITICLSIPSSRYFLHNSQIRDFDFLNIFLQSAIIKCTIFGICILIVFIFQSEATITGNIGIMISLILNLIAYLIFGVFFVMQKFATLKKNFKVFAIASIGLAVFRVVGEIVANLLTRAAEAQEL